MKRKRQKNEKKVSFEVENFLGNKKIAKLIITDENVNGAGAGANPAKRLGVNVLTILGKLGQFIIRDYYLQHTKMT